MVSQEIVALLSRVQFPSTTPFISFTSNVVRRVRKYALVAQWIEQDGSNVKVGGSTPSGGAIYFERSEKITRTLLRV